MARPPKDRRSSAPEREGIVRRPASERKRLAPELEALARGDEERLRPPPRRPRLHDPRPVALVPGVANRDARAVHDARLARIEAALVEYRDGIEGAAERLGRELLEAVQMGLWRGRSLTSFEAFAEQVVGLAPSEAQSLAERGAALQGVAADRVTDEAVALWMRSEAALLEGQIEGRASCAGSGKEETLRLELPVTQGPLALELIGRRMLPLVRDRQGDRAGRPSGPPRRGDDEPSRPFVKDRPRRP